MSMSEWDKDAWEKERQERIDRLAPLFARLRPGTPYGMISVGRGWYDLVLRLDATLAEIDPDYRIAQVKEKFGGLRYYVSNSEGYTFDGEWGDDPFRAAIQAAEAESFVTCEGCGAPGTLRTERSWNTVLCDDCEAA